MKESIGFVILLGGMIVWGLWTMHQQKKSKAKKQQHSRHE